MQGKPGLRNAQRGVLLAVIGLCAGGKRSRMDSCFRRNDDGGGNDDGGVEATSREQWEFPLSLWEKAGW